MAHSAKKPKVSDEVAHKLGLAALMQEQTTEAMSLQQKAQQIEIQLLGHMQTMKGLESAHAQLMAEQQSLAQRQMMMAQDEVLRQQQHQQQLYMAIQQQAQATQQQIATLNAQMAEVKAQQARLDEQLRQQQMVQLQALGQQIQALVPLETRRRMASTLTSFVGDMATEGSMNDSTLVLIAELRALLRDLPALIRGITDSTNAQAQGLAVSKFCRMMLVTDQLTTEQRRDWKEDVVLAFEACTVARAVPLMVAFLQRDDLQVYAALFLTLFAKGPRVPSVPITSHLHPSQMFYKLLVIQANAVPALLTLLINSQRDDVRGQVALALGNIASHHPYCRSVVLEAGAVPPLLALAQSSSNTDLVRAVAWALSVLANAEHDAFQPPWTQVLETMYTLMYRFTDEQTLVHACNTVLALQPGPVSSQACERLFGLLRNPNPDVVLATLAVIHTFVEKAEVHMFPAYGLLRLLLLSLLASENEKVRLEACRTLAAVSVKPNFEAVIDLDTLRAVSHLMARDAAVRAVAVEVIRGVTINTPPSIKQLFNAYVVRSLCSLLPMWKLQSGNIPTYQHTVVRNVLEALENILSWGRTSTVNPYASWFDDMCLDMILLLVVTLKHEEGSGTLFRQEFVTRIKALLYDIETGMDESPASDLTRSKIRNMAHWHLQFAAEEGPTIPVVAYLSNDNRRLNLPRNASLSQLHKLLEDTYQQWVVVHYLDDTNAKVPIDSHEALQKAIAKFDRDGVKTLRLFLTVSNNPLHAALPALTSSVAGGSAAAGGAAAGTASAAAGPSGKQSIIAELQQSTKFTVHELDKWVSHWMTQMPDGHTDRLRFRKAMSELGLQNDALADKIFAAFDTDGSGTINLREFITGLSVLTKGTPEEKIEVAFRAYDADRSGYIDKSELRQMMLAGLTAQGYPVDGDLLDAMVDECMELIDVDGDERISLEEFKAAWRNPQLQRQMPYLWMSDLTQLMSAQQPTA